MLLKKLLAILLLWVIIFILHSLTTNYLAVEMGWDKATISTIAKWSFWIIAFYIAIADVFKNKP